MIVGASRGLGAAFAAGLPEPGDRLLLVSRKRPDLDERDGVERVPIPVLETAPAVIEQARHHDRHDGQAEGDGHPQSPVRPKGQQQAG